MTEKLRQILVIVATTGVIFVNYLATTSQIGGITARFVSDKYPTFITPAGYAFSIWGLIYLGIISFSIYQALPTNTEKFSKIRTYYIISCLANISWIYLWHHQQLFSSVIAIITLLISLIFINVKLMDTETTAEILLAKLPFSVYFGWVTVASILNIAIYLVSLGIETTYLVSSIIGSVLIVIATIFGVIIRHKVGIAGYPIAIAWALTAIAVKQSGKTAIVITCALGVIALLISALSGIIRQDE